MMGRRIAATMVEIFTGLSAGHFLFEQFSFISAADLPIYGELLRETEGPFASFPTDHRDKLLALALRYVEPRHRLNLLTEPLKEKLLAARTALRSTAPADIAREIEFYDPERFCSAAPLRDNLLFGHIAHGVSGAADKVYDMMGRLIKEQGLEEEVYRIGLDQPCGHAGRLLFPTQRFAISLARGLIKRPDILVLNDGVLSPSDPEGRVVLQRVREAMAGKTLIMLVRGSEKAPDFDLRLVFANGRLEASEQGLDTGTAAPAVDAANTESEAAVSENEEVRTLRAVPMFANLDIARLKLLAFTSERLTFKAGDIVFRQGDPSDSAYVILAGGADVQIDTPGGPVKVSSLGASAIIGEIGIITGAPRSATIVATQDVAALCIRQEIFLSLMAEFPEMSLAVTRLIVKRMQDNVNTLSQAQQK